MNKLLTYMILISTLLSSCYSYQTVNLDSKYLEGKKYKIVEENKIVKGTLKSFDDNNVIIKSRGIEKQIPISEIKVLKIRKFSVTKTILLPITVLVVTTAIILTSGDLIRIRYSPKGNTSPP